MRSYLTTLLLIFSCAATAATEEFTFDMAGQTDRHLRVNLIHGGITVTGHDEDQIRVLADLGEPMPMTDLPSGSGMRHLPNLGQELYMNHDGGQLILRAGTDQRPVQLEVHVPRDTRLTLTARQEGAISVDGVTAEMELQNSTGPIEVHGIHSSVVAHAQSDDVTASFATADLPGPSAFSSWSGDVEVSFPPSVKADLRWRSVYGEVMTDLDVQELATVVERDIYKDEGSIKGYTTGKLNGGGAEVSVTAYSGDITLRRTTP